MNREHDRAVALTEELERFHEGAREMRNMQKTHRANSVQHINNLRQSISTLQQMISDLEAQVAHYKAAEDEVAELDRRGSSRLTHER